MIYTVPLTASPSQTLDTVLNGQFVSLYLQKRLDKLYMDVYADTKPIIQGRVCLDRQPIINEAYRGFIGELFFMDTVGNSDPAFEEIGSRFLLFYWDGQNE